MDNQSARSRRVIVAVTATAAALAVAPSAFGHASVSPAVAKAKTLQYFTLAVPTEKEGATTTKIEMTPPAGFGIDSFEPATGWKRDVQSTGSGDSTVIQKVTWSGGHTPTEEDSVFHFVASPDSAKTFKFTVRQTYSDGSVVDWSGPESSDSPAPLVKAESSIGGGSTSTLAIVALVAGGLALVIAGVGLVGSRRPLT
jgi:uncharacterized protein YcnI